MTFEASGWAASAGHRLKLAWAMRRLCVADCRVGTRYHARSSCSAAPLSAADGHGRAPGLVCNAGLEARPWRSPSQNTHALLTHARACSIHMQVVMHQRRPPVPPGCPPGYASLMVRCWSQAPEDRWVDPPAPVAYPRASPRGRTLLPPRQECTMPPSVSGRRGSCAGSIALHCLPPACVTHLPSNRGPPCPQAHLSGGAAVLAGAAAPAAVCFGWCGEPARCAERRHVAACIRGVLQVDEGFRPLQKCVAPRLGLQKQAQHYECRTQAPQT